MGDVPEQRLSEIEQLKMRDASLAERLVSLARELNAIGVRVRIAVPDGGESEIGSPTPGWNAPAVATAPSPTAVYAAQPAPGEVKTEQIASNIRAALTMIGAVLATLGIAEPELFKALGARVDVIATLIGCALPIIARVWSWKQSKTKAREKAQEIVVATHFNPATLRDAPVVAAQARQIAQHAVATVKGEAKA